MLVGHHLGGREIHRIEARGAEPVDLHARHAVAIAGAQSRHPRDIAARLAHRIDAAKHHVVDQGRIELVALADTFQGLGREVEGRHLVQGAIGFAAPARRAHMVIDEGLGHFTLPAARYFKGCARSEAS